VSDAVSLDEFRKSGLYGDIRQAFAVLPPAHHGRNSAARLIRLRLSDYFQLLDSIIVDQVLGFRSFVDPNGRLVIQVS
jgi:hypothetical protein